MKFCTIVGYSTSRFSFGTLLYVVPKGIFEAGFEEECKLGRVCCTPLEKFFFLFVFLQNAKDGRGAGKSLSCLAPATLATPCRPD